MTGAISCRHSTNQASYRRWDAKFDPTKPPTTRTVHAKGTGCLIGVRLKHALCTIQPENRPQSGCAYLIWPHRAREPVRVFRRLHYLRGWGRVKVHPTGMDRPWGPRHHDLAPTEQVSQAGIGFLLLSHRANCLSSMMRAPGEACTISSLVPGWHVRRST